jgi:hypothetical protein
MVYSFFITYFLFRLRRAIFLLRLRRYFVVPSATLLCLRRLCFACGGFVLLAAALFCLRRLLRLRRGFFALRGRWLRRGPCVAAGVARAGGRR